MKLTEASLRNPAAVAVVVAIVAFFGLTSLLDLALQLFPDIARPQMTVQAGWRAASPQEMESEIVEPIESVLEGLPGIEQMDANVNPGGAWINLTFAVGTAIVVAFGADLITGITASIACLGNIGPGFGAVGPMDSFAPLHPVSKIVLTLEMWIGRLEVMTVLVFLRFEPWRSARWRTDR
jgi:hypothetical protein